MASDWYYTRNGQQAPGPVSSAQLKQLAAAGQLKPDDLVWKQGLPNWVPANTLKNLFPAAPAPAPPPPVRSAPTPAVLDVVEVVEEVGVANLIDFGPPPARVRTGGTSSDFLPQLLFRLLAWDVSATNVTRGEQQTLAAAGITGPAGQRYFAWRRAFLFGVVLATLVSAVFLFIDVFKQHYFDVFGAVGILTVVLNLLATLALPGLALTAALLWARPGTSRFLLLLGLAIGLLVPMLTNLMPFHWKIKAMPSMGLEGLEGPPGRGAGPSAAAGMGAVQIILLLPYLLGVGAGWLRGGVRIKTLVPPSVLPGWMVLAAAPHYLLLALFTVAFFAQVVPNFLLFLALVFLLLTPLIYLVLPRMLIRSGKKSERGTALPLLDWLAFGGHCLGALFLLILILAEKPVEFRPVATLYCQFLALSLYASAVAADLVLAASVSVWRNQAARTKDGSAAELDQVMTEIEPAFGK
jgi:hypothetical protein